MEKLLPVGSIVDLKDVEKSFVVIGYHQVDEAENHFDYVGCFFPEGYINDELMFFFNHTDIENVKKVSLINDETRLFSEKLEELGLTGITEESGDENG